MKHRLTTQQIGKCGELLTQLTLLKHGIESSPMTTDTGVDLVAYSPRTNKAITIQVKSVQRPKPGGGKGRLSVDWYVPLKNHAQYFAFVDISRDKVWMMSRKQLEKYAQQRTDKRFHFFLIVDPAAPKRRDGKPHLEHQFERYICANMVHQL